MTFNYINTTGVVVADTSDTLAQVQGEWKQAFGQDLSVDPSTPQGVMIAAETATRTAVAQASATLANQINPNLAGGVFLDALCALLGIQRRAATATIVTNVHLTGIGNTNIPTGARAQTAAGDVFTLQTGVVLDVAGSAYGTFIAQTAGPIPCANNALAFPVDAILGWDAVTNNQSGSPASVTTLGQNQETDAQLRLRRNNTLAAQGISTVEAQISDLYNINGVSSVAFLENVADTTQTINGVSLVAHSVWACVDGGTDLQVATSLLKNKTDGANWNGAVTVNVIEPSSGQTYAVKFDRPTYVFIYGALTIKQGTYTGDLQANAPQAVADYFVGNVDGFAALGIGQTVSPFEIAAAIVSRCPGCIVLGCSIGTVPGSLTPTDITMTQKQRAQTNTTAFTVTVQP